MMNSMSISRYVRMGFALLALVAMAGCSSMSLFSDRHVHYHGSDKADDKIEELQNRLEALEKTAK